MIRNIRNLNKINTLMKLPPQQREGRSFSDAFWLK
jgi:hypothetical protein